MTNRENGKDGKKRLELAPLGPLGIHPQPIQDIMKTYPKSEPHKFEAVPIGRAHVDHAIGRLRHALTDSRNHPSAYPILARYGEMEQTANGFVAIDPETVVSRCKRLLAKLESY